MAQLGLRLLGGFMLRADARPRPLPARKAQALLAYLALRAGRTHPRESLTALLWDEVGDKQARQSLRQTLLRVRRALAGAHRAVLVAQGDTVALNPSAVEVDAVRFERLVRRGTPEALDAALALYEGPLLDGFRVSAAPFEQWLEAERARLHELALGALRRLMERHLKAGRVEEATEAAGRLVALDPVQEDAQRTLMRLHAQGGRRAAALRQYQACVAILQKELGVEPEPETRRLYLDLLQRAATPARAAGARRAPAPPPALVPVDAPLVGRDDELARLRQHLEAARRGRGHVVLVTGEPGIGKSRLVEELAAEAAAGGARALVGHGYESEQILPFRPWMHALHAGRALAQASERVRGSRAMRTELARLFPELAGEGAPPSITAESHLRLFEAIDALLADLAHGAPLLVILEDLQWADEMSLRLLAFVGRRLGDRPVLLVGTVREGEESASFRRMASELTALPHVAQIGLGGLSQPATASLVRALARAGSDDAGLAALVGKVWALSEGSPFVIVETMRALREGRLPEAADVELPQRVRDVITARIDRLSPRAQELARAASVFTRDFEFTVLQRAAGLPRRETAEAVEELVRRRILDAVGERFDFTHVRLRQAVYQGLLAPRRQALHAAIGEAVETVYAGRLDEWYDRLAYHFARADEPAKTLTYLVHLADKVARSYALDEAVRVLRDALGYTDRLPEPERRRRRLDIAFRLALALGLLGRSAEVRDMLLALAPVVEGLGDPSLSGAYHFWLANTYGNLGETELALTHARRALEEAARGGDEITMGQASYALSRESYMSGQGLAGITHGRQAVALLEARGERWWLGQSLWVLALNLLHVGDFTPALEVMHRLRELGESVGEIRLQAFAAWTAGRIYTVMGEADEAIVAGRRGVELAADPVGRATALGWLGAAYQEGGHTDEAIRALEDAIGQLQRLSGAGGYRYRQLDGLLAALLSETYLVKGDLARARELGEHALSITTAGGWPVAVGYAERAMGRITLALGRVADAEALLRRALRTFAAVDARCQVARSHLAVAEACAARGDLEAAGVELRTAHELFLQMRTPQLVERTARRAKELGVPLDSAPSMG